MAETTKKTGDVKNNQRKTEAKASKEKDKYVRKLEKRVKDWNKKIAHFQKKVSKSTDEAATKMQDSIDSLVTKSDEVKERVIKIRSASGEAWKDLKSGLEGAVQSLEEGFKKMSERYKQPGDSPSNRQ